MDLAWHRQQPSTIALSMFRVITEFTAKSINFAKLKSEKNLSFAVPELSHQSALSQRLTDQAHGVLHQSRFARSDCDNLWLLLSNFNLSGIYFHPRDLGQVFAPAACTCNLGEKWKTRRKSCKSAREFLQLSRRNELFFPLSARGSFALPRTAQPELGEIIFCVFEMDFQPFEL